MDASARTIVRPFEPPRWNEVKAISEQSGLDFDLEPDKTIPVIVQLVVCVDGVVARDLDGDLKLAPDPRSGETVPIKPWEGYLKNMPCIKLTVVVDSGGSCFVKRWQLIERLDASVSNSARVATNRRLSSVPVE